MSAQRLFIESIIFFGSGFSFVLALGQLVRSRSRDNVLLAACFFLMALWQFLGGCVYAGFDKVFAFNVYALSIPCYYSSIPLIYFYFKRILGGPPTRQRHQLRHIVLPLLSIVASLPLVNRTTDLYNDMNLKSVRSLPLRGIVPVLCLYSAAALFCVYVVALVIKIAELRRDAENRPRRLIDVTLAVIGVVGLVNIWWILDRVLSLGTLPSIYAVFTSLLILLYLISIRHPEYMFEMRKEAERARYARSRLRGVNVECAVDELESILRDEQAYLDPDISLNGLAERLGLTPHQLSEIINVRLEKSFFSLIDGYRIEHAKQALTQDPKRKVVDIAFDVGFNTQSTFYNAFKKHVGKSPSEYRSSL